MSDDTTEHPDDRAMRLESEQYGREHAAEFCSDHARDMQLLVETWSDGEAAELFEHLRELFWARLWTPHQSVEEDVIKACERLGQLYRENAKACDAAGNHLGAANDLHGALACDECVATIRELVGALPGKGTA